MRLARMSTRVLVIVTILIVRCQTVAVPSSDEAAGVLHRSSSTTAACRQNSGRNCTASELAVPYLTRSTTVDYVFDSMKLLEHGQFAISEPRSAIINPALCVANNTLWLIARFQMSNGTGIWTRCPGNSLYHAQRCPIDHLRMISFNVFGKLDANFELVGDLFGLDYNLDFETGIPLKELEYGPEDPRVLTWGEEMYLTFNAPPISSRWLSHDMKRMKIQRLFPQPGVPIELVLQSSDGSDPQQTLREKNWAPIDVFRPSKVPAFHQLNVRDGDEFLFARYIEPHIVVRCSRSGHCLQVANTSNAAFFTRFQDLHVIRAFHLATNAVRLSDDHYGGLFHALRGAGHGIHQGPRRYLCIPYMFEANFPYKIVKVRATPLDISPPNGKGFVFCSSLTFVDGLLVIGYGWNDQGSAFTTRTVDSVFSDMLPTD